MGSGILKNNSYLWGEKYLKETKIYIPMKQTNSSALFGLATFSSASSFKTFLLIFTFCVFSIRMANCQEAQDANIEPREGEVAVITTGEGATKEQATHVALRSAIEQTYGVFVSSDTKILDDELVSDEIITVSSGNIQHYYYISERLTEEGKYEVTVKSIVSYRKLAAFVKNKGGSAELSLGNLVENFKIEQFYAENEKKALKNLVSQIKKISRTAPFYDVSIKVAPPERINPDGSGNINIEVIASLNVNAAVVFDLFWGTIQGLAVRKPVSSQGLLQYGTSFRYWDGSLEVPYWSLDDYTSIIRLYSSYDEVKDVLNAIKDIVNQNGLFILSDNLGNQHPLMIRDLESFYNLEIEVRREINNIKNKIVAETKLKLKNDKKKGKNKKSLKSLLKETEMPIYLEYEIGGPSFTPFSEYKPMSLRYPGPHYAMDYKRAIDYFNTRIYTVKEDRITTFLQFRPTKEGIPYAKAAFSKKLSSQELSKLTSVNVNWLNPGDE